jgi:hypothetical protein
MPTPSLRPPPGPRRGPQGLPRTTLPTPRRGSRYVGDGVCLDGRSGHALFRCYSLGARGLPCLTLVLGEDETRGGVRQFRSGQVVSGC